MSIGRKKWRYAQLAERWGFGEGGKEGCPFELFENLGRP
jgi:hypothetical protein